MTSKILVLDDEASAQQVIENFLIAEGYDLRFAVNGVEGLEQARAWQPDVILCDVMMPVMDGFAFCRHIRADASLAQVPIILVTALSDRQAKLSGLQAGADDFLSKPVDAYELRARLRTLTRLDRFRKLNEQRAILEAESVRRRILFEESPDGILVIDAQTAGFLEFNTSAHTQLGYTREEFARLHIFDVEAQETAEETRKHIGNVLQHGRSDFETLQRTKQGELRNVHVTAQIVDILGQPVYYCTWRDITERRRAEEALRISEAHFATIFHSSPNAIALARVSDNTMIDVNAAWEEITCWSKEEAVGKTPQELKLWGDPSERERMKAEIIAHGVLRGFEIKMRPRSGPLVSLLMSAELITLQGEPCMLTIAQDITARKQAEQALVELNQTLEQRVRERTAEVQDLYEHAPVGYHALDANGTIQMVNQTQLDWLGYTREELIGQPMASILTPASAAAFAEGFPAFKERGSVRDLEFEMVRKDGTLIPVLLGATAVYDEQGAYLMSRSTVFDNSERKQADLALRESEAQSRLLFEESPDAIALFSVESRLIQFNRAFEELSGYSAAQLLGQTLNDVGMVPQETTRELTEVVRERLRSTSTFVAVEMRIRRANGEFRDVGLRVFGLRIRGKPHYLITMRDITSEKQVEETLRQANAELAQAARAKDEFLANMSHELRTPLNAILGISETLLEQVRGPLNAQQQASVRMIDASGRHLLALITDILDLSKVEAGRLELQIERVSVAEVCQASLLFVKEQATKKALRLSFTLNDQLAMMESDPRRLKQMLVNLLSNAVKFTPDRGAVRLEVEIDAEAGAIRFAVQDTGIGIAPEELARLFQPFKQIDSSLSRQHEGTGLGLALVRRLAELHGGSVTVESAPEQGSCFTIRLPYRSPSAAQGETQAPASDHLRQRTPIHSALVVEDSESAAEQLVRYLQETGVRVMVHRQGMGAVEQAIRLQPTVIFLDILMPDRSGWMVLAQLKADPRTRNIPVVTVTVVDDRSRALAAGATEHILKPFTREVLRRALHIIATNQEAQQALVIVPPPPPPDGARVLLVEDNEFNLLSISDYLQSRGYALSVARNGREALSRIDASQPELILMDIQMPELDGLETTRRLRATPAYAHVPIIALTALAMPGDRERCLEAGANEYLTKPVSLRGLVEMMEALLNR